MKSMPTVASLFVFCGLVFGGAAFAQEAISASGVRPHSIEIQPNPATGRTTEQENIAERYHRDNMPGAVKHLYVISPTSGVVILYSTVQGKVTSGGKRLTPRSTILKCSCGKDCTTYEGQRVIIGGEQHIVTEPIQDDGTYGSSSPYMYWNDAHGRYHQHFFTDGQVIAILDQPLVGKKIVINTEIEAKPGR